MTQVGTGKYTYELIRDFFKLPAGQAFGLISRVAADAQDRIYVFQRKDPPVVVFDREGKYLGAWGSGEVTDPHGLKIVGDIVYTTDRSNSVAKSFTLDGKPLLELGQRGVHSDTGCTRVPLARRARGRAVQSPHRDDGPPQRRHLRDRRLPQRPRAPLHARRQAGHVVGHAGQGRGPVPPAAQHRLRPCRQALRRRPVEQAHPDLHARRRLPRPVDRHGRAERHQPRQGRQFLHRRAGRRAASPPMSASATRTVRCSPAWRAAMSTASASTRAATSTPA